MGFIDSVSNWLRNKNNVGGLAGRVVDSAYRGKVPIINRMGEGFATPRINHVQKQIEIQNEAQRQHILKRARQQPDPVKREKLFDIVRKIQTPNVLQEAAPSIADPNYHRNIGKDILNVATAAIPAMRVPGAIAKASPAVRLAGSGAVRGLENAAFEGGRQIIDRKFDPKALKNAALMGAALNTALSPKLSIQAGKQIGGDFKKAFTIDPATGKLVAKPGFAKVPEAKTPRVTETQGRAQLTGKALETPASKLGLDVRINEPTRGDRVRRVMTSGEAELRRMGPAGRELSDKILGTRKTADMTEGRLKVALADATQGLNRVELDDLTRVLDEGIAPTSDRVAEAAKRSRAILDEVATGAEQRRLQIRTPDGESVPFTRRENYFPRKYNFDALAKGKQREEAIRHLVQTGQAQNVSEADKILEQFIQNNVSRKAGNLEFARTLDLPGFERDPRKAIGSYLESSSKRFAEADNYGLNDEVSSRLIDRVRQEGGDSRYAQEVFDLMTGQKKYKNTAVDLATKFNYITKLDLGFITNATQSVNTATKFGVINTLQSIIETVAKPNQMGKLAKKAGAIDDAISMGKAEGLSMGRMMETVLAPFSFGERKNRVISTLASQKQAQSMVKKLLNNPNHKTAMRQLRSVGIDPEKILAQGGLKPEDILGAGYEGTRRTQFKVDAIDIPPGWKTNVGRLLSQFKSFSFKQSQFVRDEVLKEAFVHGNFSPLVRLTALAVPASFVAQSVRNKLTGREEDSDEKGLDVRKWDKYLKAFGTVPTELATQAKFLFDTYNNPYATPIKKIGRTASTFLGPTVGEASNITNALESMGSIRRTNEMWNQDKDPNLEAKRIAAGYVPFAGEYAKNTLFPFPKTYAETSKNEGKELSDQLKKAKKGKEVGESPIAETAEGKFAFRIGSEKKTADTRKEAELAIAKDKFKQSDKIFQVQGDQVFRKNKNGDVSVTSKLEYDENLNYRKLNIAKDSKNFKTWGELAVKQLDYYKQQLEDPTLDELEALDIMDRYATLTREMQKYAGYGGFTKPKKGKKAKKLNISLGSMSDTPTTTKRFATPKFASPKIAGLKNVRVKVAGLKAPKKSSGGGLKPVRGRGIKIVK